MTAAATMQAGPSIVVVGSLNADTVLSVPRLPAAGDTVVGAQRAERFFGGKGANQAAAAARFLGPGGRVAMVGRVGSDADGDGMRAALAALGVDVSAVLPTSGGSGHATIAVDPSGENLIIVDPGANSVLAPVDVRLQSVAAADVVLLQMEVPTATVRAAVDHARGRVVLNPAPAEDARDLLAGPDVLVPNRQELAVLVGERPAERVEDVLAQTRRLQTTAEVVVTLGHRGALVVDRDRHGVLVAAPAVEAVDSTGAGDCFCGVLAGLLAEGRSLEDATRAAVVAASLSVRGAGARGSLPARVDVEQVTGW
jgi:ribokinase